ncbi:class B sortase [Clostridioides sp. GD02377]|uniref:class B sortase n=1 Tax=unclassified Clostridioides TaxID=2635829 RepID=UPI0038ACC68B
MKIYNLSKKKIALATFSIVFLAIMSAIVIKSINDRNKINENINDYKENVKIIVNNKEELPYLKVDIKKLNDKNKDIIAWLRIPSISLDMPIVQGDNNEFYLNHDIDKNKNSAGWAFIDSRNNLNYLDMNTVLYGHNLRNKQFGLLKRLLDNNINNKKDFDLIQFTTEDKEMIFKISSIYIVKENNWSYTEISFEKDDRKASFIENIKDKNIKKIFSKNNLSFGDKILTFSTCYGNSGTNKRLVVHAKLEGIKNLSEK